MRADLMDRVDKELQLGGAAPSRTRRWTELTQEPGRCPSNYAVRVCRAEAAPSRAGPTGGHRHARPAPPARDRPPGHSTTSRSRSARHDGGRPKWRFVAGAARRDRTRPSRRHPAQHVDHPVRRLCATSRVIGVVVARRLRSSPAWFAVRRAFRPLTRIEDTAAAIAAGDLTQRIPAPPAARRGHLPLARRSTSMLAQIEPSFAVREASEERMRQFVADASHELRTPLATVRGLRRALPPGRRERAARTSPVRHGADRGRGHADGRPRRGPAASWPASTTQRPVVDRPPVDLTVLAADAAQDARVRAPDRRISLLGLDGPLGADHGAGRRARLRQVVTNLVAQRAAATPPPAPPSRSPSAAAPPAGAALEVRDHGPACPDEVATQGLRALLPRRPLARGRSGGGGNGLGLAIVAAIVSQHHGRVGVAPTPGGGATFVVDLHSRLPAADQRPFDLGRVDWHQSPATRRRAPPMTQSPHP